MALQLRSGGTLKSLTANELTLLLSWMSNRVTGLLELRPCRSASFLKNCKTIKILVTFQNKKSPHLILHEEESGWLVLKETFSTLKQLLKQEPTWQTYKYLLINMSPSYVKPQQPMASMSTHLCREQQQQHATKYHILRTQWHLSSKINLGNWRTTILFLSFYSWETWNLP